MPQQRDKFARGYPERNLPQGEQRAIAFFELMEFEPEMWLVQRSGNEAGLSHRKTAPRKNSAAKPPTSTHFKPSSRFGITWTVSSRPPDSRPCDCPPDAEGCGAVPDTEISKGVPAATESRA